MGRLSLVTQDKKGRINTACPQDTFDQEDRQGASDKPLQSADYTKNPGCKGRNAGGSRLLITRETQLIARDRQLGTSDKMLGASDRQLGACDRQLGTSDRQLTGSERQLSACDWIGLRTEEIELDGSWYQPRTEQAQNKRTGR